MERKGVSVSSTSAVHLYYSSSVALNMACQIECALHNRRGEAWLTGAADLARTEGRATSVYTCYLPCNIDSFFLLTSTTAMKFDQSLFRSDEMRCEEHDETCFEVRGPQEIWFISVYFLLCYLLSNKTFALIKSFTFFLCMVLLSFVIHRSIFYYSCSVSTVASDSYVRSPSCSLSPESLRISPIILTLAPPSPRHPQPHPRSTL